MKTKVKNPLCMVVAYILGTDKDVYEKHISKEFYGECEEHKDLKNIRMLCKLRNSIMLNYKAAEYAGKYNITFIENWPNIDIEALNYIRKNIDPLNNVDRQMPLPYLKLINTIIKNNILDISNTVMEIPICSKKTFRHIQRMLVFEPNLKDHQLLFESKRYFAHHVIYPYNMYVNTALVESDFLENVLGKLLFDDETFCRSVGSLFSGAYRLNMESKDFEIHYQPLTVLDRFLNNKETIMFVDCENSEPEYVELLLNTLSSGQLNNIQKIILVEGTKDPNALRWQEMNHNKLKFVKTGRIHNKKSLVDFRLMSEVYEAYYKDGINSFIIMSSDSDFYSLISLPDTEFCFLFEKKITSDFFITALHEQHIDFADLGCLKWQIKQRKYKEGLNSAITENIDDISFHGDNFSVSTLPTANKLIN